MFQLCSHSFHLFEAGKITQWRLLEVSTKTTAKNGQNFPLENWDRESQGLLTCHLISKRETRQTYFGFPSLEFQYSWRFRNAWLLFAWVTSIFLCYSANLKRINCRWRFSLNPVLTLEILPSAVVNLPGKYIVLCGYWTLPRLLPSIKTFLVRKKLMKYQAFNIWMKRRDIFTQITSIKARVYFSHGSILCNVAALRF